MISRVELTQAEIKDAIDDARKNGIEPPYRVECRIPGTFVPDSVVAYAEKFGVVEFVGYPLVPPYGAWHGDPRHN
jgi:hypothetical protein